MALASCRECGERVSTEAPTCPHCGAPEPGQWRRPPGGYRWLGCIGAVLLFGAIGAVAARSGKMERAPFVVDVLWVAGYPPAEVERILGLPSTVGSTTYDGQQHPKLYYRGDSISVVYIDNRAEWIGVTPPRGVPFESRSLERFGVMGSIQPDERGDNVLRWRKGSTSFHLIQLHRAAGESRVDLAQFFLSSVP